jgi:hypothetical protein
MTQNLDEGRGFFVYGKKKLDEGGNTEQDFKLCWPNLSALGLDFIKHIIINSMVLA